MSENKVLWGIHACRRTSQAGVAAVEFALLVGVFFLLVFAALETARVIYVFNTLQEVTRRAASELVNMRPADPNSSGIVAVRRRAIFRETGDGMPFAEPITIEHVRVEYLSLVRSASGSMTRVPTSPLPTCPVAHRQICMADPNDSRCVRFVRVRICQPGDANNCTPVPYTTYFSLLHLSINLPRSATIATAESLGYIPGKPCS